LSTLKTGSTTAVSVRDFEPPAVLPVSARHLTKFVAWSAAKLFGKYRSNTAKKVDTEVKLLILLALSCTSAMATAATYKWTDSSGNIQFGQYPPAGVEAEYIEPPPSVKPAGDQDKAIYNQLEQLEQSRAEREQKKIEAQREQQQATARSQACEQARQDLANLQLGGHRRMRLPDGTVTYLDAEQKQRYIDTSKQNIRDNCD
jgi:hypothetical protein